MIQIPQMTLMMMIQMRTWISNNRLVYNATQHLCTAFIKRVVLPIYPTRLEVTLDGLRDTLGKVVNVAAVEAGHGNTTVGRHVNVRLLRKRLGLGLSEAGEAGVSCQQGSLSVPLPQHT